MDLLSLSQLGQVLSGVSLGTAAAVGAYTAFIIKQRDNLKENSATYRNLYQEFWHNEEISKIRRCVINNKEYEQIRDVLARRNTTAKNNLTHEENDIIELVDQFCAMLVRIKSFSERDLPKERAQLWRKMLNGDRWLREIRERPELYEYIKNHWEELSSSHRNGGNIPSGFFLRSFSSSAFCFSL